MAIDARRIIRASPDRVFAHIGRVESLPRYGAPLWMAADPVEKRRSAHVITLTGYLIGLPVESVLRITLRPPHALEFKQVRGTLRALSGQCSLVAVEDGTEVRYRLEADPGIAMITDEAARQFLVQFVERMLDRIKLAAERKAPPRRFDRAAAAGSPLREVEVGEDEAEAASEDTAPAPIPEGRAAGPAPHEGPETGKAAPPGGRAAAPRAIESGPTPPAFGGPAPAEGRPGPTRSGRRRRRRRRGRGRGPGSPGQGPSPSGA
jgi:hypothetical protein